MPKVIVALALTVALWPLPCVAGFDRGPRSPPPLSDAECKVAPVDPAHEFVAAGVMKGNTLASVQLGNAHNVSTIVRVTVAPGQRPLTVFLSSAEDGVIWDIEGATDRVRRAVVAGPIDRSVAVRGLPAERIEFPEFARCRWPMFPPWRLSDDKRDRSFEFLFGRKPERIVFANEGPPNLLALPVAVFTTAPPGAKGALDIERDPDGKMVEHVIDRSASKAADDLVTYHPGGFRELDAGSIVSPVAVITPETFPSYAGLLQLERKGAIHLAKPQEIAAFVEGISRPYRTDLTPHYRMNARIDYVVTRDVMLPPGLGMNFLVLDGVPSPRGDVGNGCVYGMSQFTVSAPHCLGGDQFAIEFLRSIDLNADLSACRLLEPPPGAAMEAVATYESSPRRKPGVAMATPILVRVTRPGDVVLVLDDLGPVVWRIEAAPGTRIAGILLTGYHTSSVEAVPPTTPIALVGHNSRNPQSRWDPICAPFLNDLPPAYFGGPNALALDAKVKAFTGRHLDGFRNGYALDEIEIQ